MVASAVYPRRVIEKHGLTTNALSPTVSSACDANCVNGFSRLNYREMFFMAIFIDGSSRTLVQPEITHRSRRFRELLMHSERWAASSHRGAFWDGKYSSQPLKRRRRVDDREESQRSRGKRRGMMFRKGEDDQFSQIKPMFLARYFPKFDSHPNFFSYNLVFKSPAIHSISYPRTNASYNI